MGSVNQGRKARASSLGLVAAALLGMALFGSLCESTPPESGGGLFGGGSSSSAVTETWDILFLNTGAVTCPKGFPGSGAQINPLLPGGMFPGVPVQAGTGEYDADVPEAKILGYFLLAPGLVPAGSPVHVHFVFQSQADGEHGDYFLCRILDGDRFLVPAQVADGMMSWTDVWTVDYDYTAAAAGFGLEFIIGLGDATDAWYLDDLQVTVAGTPLVMDDFESPPSTWTNPAVLRTTFLPANMQGSLSTQAATALVGAQSLMATGGRYFQLYGQGASSGGTSGLILTYTDPDYLSPFFGQTQAVLQGGVYLGDYLGFDNATVTTCSEEGSVTIAVNPAGNADLSGTWSLALQAMCQSGLPFLDAVPGPITVSRQAMMFVGAPVSTATGTVMDTMAGLSMGNMGMFMLGSTTAPSQAQLLGTYDPGSRVFTGQVMGTLPGCAVSMGQFTATIQ